MTDYVLGLQGMASSNEEDTNLQSDFTTVLCGASWWSITC